jgi:Transglutaminase-like superfamily
VVADPACYAQHSRWTEPGPLAAHLDDLPSAPSALSAIVGGLVLHPLFALAPTTTSEASLRTIKEILAAILERDGQPLDKAREPSKRVLGTCRNYALLACATLRHHQIPARLRVGFADYFTSDFMEDHWVCEYHDGSVYRLLDAELTAEIRGRFGIKFDAANVPRNRFLTAALAWKALRRGGADPARYGVSSFGLTGLWFTAGSLMRDLAALGSEEMMPWDYWGPTRNFGPERNVSEEWLGRFDRLADDIVHAPEGHKDVRAIAAAHSWAAVPAAILSSPDGKPVEVQIGR